MKFNRLLSITAAVSYLLLGAGIAETNAAERSLTELSTELAAGRLTSRSLTHFYLARIERINPRLRAVIAVNPRALEEARGADARRAARTALGPFDGVPILIKDNIDVAGGLPTTAGSLALIDNKPLHDAPLVARLRAAGFVILGKTNLSEWANIRSNRSSSGWSAVGGITRNPYALDRTACGSSSGSAAAVASDLAPVAIGTETDGSITCPAAMNGLVGIKPTVGLVSRTGIVPISRSQDTAGPLTRNVADAALLLDVITGSDPADPMTRTADQHHPGTDIAGMPLKGVRLGVMRFLKGYSPRTLAVFDRALQTLQAQGAVLVDIGAFEFGDMGDRELTLLLTEFKAGVDDYLARTPPVVTTRSLAALIDFDRAEPRELAWFDQELFERALSSAGVEDQGVVALRTALKQAAGPDGIDRLLRENDVSALVGPTTGPAWTIDNVNGDPDDSSAGKLPAVAGYPHVTVPMGNQAGLPLGLSFIGAAWSEQRLLSLAYAFEQAARARHPPPADGPGPPLQSSRRSTKNSSSLPPG